VRKGNIDKDIKLERGMRWLIRIRMGEMIEKERKGER
jgi:hypothetical protein